MGRLIFLTYFYLIAPLIHIVLIGLIQFKLTKLLQKSEMRKEIVIELSYKGFSRASDYS